MNNNQDILGHRGARAEVLENTKAGFNHAHKLASIGLAGIEFDAQLTTDGKLILTHDNHLDRLCRQQGCIEQLTAKYCQKSFKSHTGFELLELADVVEFLPNFTNIELELKTHERMNNQRFVQVLASQFFVLNLHTLPIALTSFDTDLLRRLQYHPTLSSVPRGLLIEDKMDNAQIINLALRLQCSRIGINHQLINPELITLSKRYNLDATAWTVNNLEDAKRLFRWGVNTVITDYPTTFLNELY